jgi:hypothetical protein
MRIFVRPPADDSSPSRLEDVTCALCSFSLSWLGIVAIARASKVKSREVKTPGRPINLDEGYMCVGQRRNHSTVTSLVTGTGW